MSERLALFVFIICLMWVFVFALMTSGVTEDQRAEMMDDEELWP